jgi:hypothetical protein
MKDARAILFDGDGYSREWHEEAARRGLPDYKDTVEALPHLLDAKNVDVFGKYRVLSKREVESRFEIYMEQYIKTVNIEAETTASIARTSILPAALSYQTRIAESVNAVSASGCDSKGGRELLAEVCDLVSEFKAAIDALVRVNDHETPATRLDHGLIMRDPARSRIDHARSGSSGHESRACFGRPPGEDRSGRSLAAAEVPGDALHQVSSGRRPASSCSRGPWPMPRARLSRRTRQTSRLRLISPQIRIGGNRQRRHRDGHALARFDGVRRHHEGEHARCRE